MKRFILLSISLCFLLTCFGCETMKGIGRDLENTGENIWDIIKSDN